MPITFYANYDYDMAGDVTAVRENGATSGVGLLASYSYDSLGRRASVAFGNGTVRNYAYDPISRLAGLKIDLAGTANDQLIGAVAGVGTAIGYTPSSQIASIAKSNDAYAWPGSYNVDRLYTTNGLNQYTNSGGVTIGYDGRGNLNTSGSATYSYDGLNRMTAASGGITIGYDPADRLSQYVVGSATTKFYYAGDALVAELSGGAITNRYVPGPGTDEPIVWYVGSTTAQRRFLQADERGSIVAVSDSSGSWLATNTYDEFGIPSSTNVGRFQYTGQKWFSELGLYDYNARWYSPTLGRFMQTDPIGYGDGLNFYNYAHGDPINEIDPNGLAGDPPAPSGQKQDDIVVTGRRLKRTVYITIGSSFSYGGQVISNPGVYDIGDTRLTVILKPQSDNAPRIDCNSSARQLAKLASAASTGLGASALLFGALGGGPPAAILGGAALVADGVNALAGGYIAYSEGDYAPLKSSVIGFVASGAAGFATSAFGGSVTRGLGGVIVSKAPSKFSIGAASYGSGQASSLFGQQSCP